MKSVIISDLHLSPSRPEITRAFNQFIEGFPKDVGELFILGDLFEVWLGDDDSSIFAQAIIESIRRLSRSGVQTYFQRGNRDFLVGKRFSKETSCKILPDFSVHDIRGHKILLTHGDLLCTDDDSYQRFRRRIQAPFTKWVLTHLPMSYRRKLATKLRTASTEAAANKPENIMDVNQKAVEECLERFDVITIVHGHTHRPAVHELKVDSQPAKRFTLGDWASHLWWVEIDEQNVELKSVLIDGQVNWGNIGQQL